jgi:hypothetical protein
MGKKPDAYLRIMAVASEQDACVTQYKSTVLGICDIQEESVLKSVEV